MSDAEEIREQEQDAPHTLWWAAVSYGGVMAFGWLVLAIYKLLRWRTRMAHADAIGAGGDLELADQVRAFAGSLLVDMGYGLFAAAIGAFVVFALLRRSWNAWDYATVTAWFATLGSGIFLCASNRVMFWLPFTFAPLLVLLYTPGVKTTAGVRPSASPSIAMDAVPSATPAQGELAREIARERTLVTQLRQNLDVFEVERGISTDVFVDRYVKGLEDETPDNAEWFSIARAVRRSQERIGELQAQLETQG